MASRQRTGSGPAARRPEIGAELLALGAWVAAVFALLSLLSARAGAAANWGGRLGQALVDVLLPALGWAAFLPFVALGFLAVDAWRGRLVAWTPARAAAVVGLVLSFAALLALAAGGGGPGQPGAGGWLGGWLGELVRQHLGGAGATAAAALATLACAAAAVGSGAVSWWRRLRLGWRGAVASLGRGVRRWGRRPQPVAGPPVSVRNRTGEPAAPAAAEEPQPSGEAAEVSAAPGGRPPIVVPEAGERPPFRPRRRTVVSVQDELPFADGKAFRTPPLRFLDPPSSRESRVDEDALWKSSRILESKLADFGIQGKVVEVRPGPVITTFDIEPAPGVKVNRIVSLADDLAMALRVPGVRILAPVPGKGVVGIEVANARREEVRLRELLEDDRFARSASPLTLALGKDTAGTPVFGDLARMPHLLVAGATGSGKSVALNAMILSILYKATPARVRFVMIDLKMLELSVYEDIPHLLVPVVTDPKRAVVVLRNIVEQMDERYRLMKRRGVRNIDQYNSIVEQELRARGHQVVELEGAEDEGDGALAAVGPPAEPLPKVVVIIDELADLMMTMGRQVEEPITRLAQKARAAGIHLIVATQRPSVDVITGLIKANFPARISFQTTTRVDSRTIIDQIGAERLLGGGDMLYMPPAMAPRVQRLQGPFVTEAEIERVVEFCRSQGAPQYALGLLETPEEEESGDLEDDLADELYDHAVRLVTESGQASISWVQRRLRVGYNRAARMIERMEREGIVSAAEGGRPREVLVGKGEAS